MNLAPDNSLNTVGVSVSESPDLGVLGLSAGHLREAMAEIALLVLASGYSLAYGGDLRQQGFTSFLFNLLVRYRDHPHHSHRVGVTCYLAWPVHIRMTQHKLAAIATEHESVAHLVYLAENGERLDWEQRLKLPEHEPDDREWAAGLTAMRNVMRKNTGARVVLGGKLEGFKGTMPGIAEETYLSLRARQPVFLIGGYGGCARDIAETMGLIERWAGSRGAWQGREQFDSFVPDDLNNGLSEQESATLANTPHIQEAVTLVSRGLYRLLAREKGGEECA